MARSTGHSTPKYRKHRATGQAVVTVAGKDHYLGPHGTKASLVEYDRLVGEWLAAGRPTTATAAGSDLTVAELCRAYKKYATAYYAKLDNITTAMKTLRLRYGATLAIDFGPLALKAVRQQFVDDGHSRTYVNRLVDLIRRAFKWAASEQLISMTTWQALTTVTGLRQGHTEAPENNPILPIDDAIVDATLPHLPDAVADMVRLERLTGMRPDEVCGLRPSDIDRSGDVWSYSPQHHKMAHAGKNRVVFIGPKGKVILVPYLLRAAESFCFVPAEVVAATFAKRNSKRKTSLSCGNRTGTNRIRRKPRRTAGERYNVNSYRRAIHRACDAADDAAHKLDGSIQADKRIVPRWSPNRLRHTAATEIRKRFGLESAQVVLGHSKPNTTLIYAERDLLKAAAIMAEVG
ncbi:MAG TPA: site-specific integrase [Pirellulales bacterium]|jgi:integrase